jgi:CubicO group peptidase (beta-lactamase class C family)
LNSVPQFGSLTAAYGEQERRFARAFAVLDEGIREKAFPGAVAAVVSNSELVLWKALGRFTYAPESAAVSADAIWDLASVTKVVATTAAAMLLYERGKLELELPLSRVVPEFAAKGADSRRERVTLRMLLTHSSGLPAYYRMYEEAGTSGELLRACYSMPLECEPGTRAEYSDIGFILLGVALERLAQESLDTFCQREVFEKLGLRETGYRPPATWHDRVPPTEDDRRFRNRVVQGEVNDENACVLGGVAGHAGVFSTALEVARFGYCMLSGGSPLVRRDTVDLFTRRESSPAGTSRALGWDTPSQPSQSGKYFSVRSFGHLGFTGTSLWCDPERRLCVVLLTNRTWPDRGSQLIKQIRPRFHDAVIESLQRT